MHYQVLNTKNNNFTCVDNKIGMLKGEISRNLTKNFKKNYLQNRAPWDASFKRENIANNPNNVQKNCMCRTSSIYL